MSVRDILARDGIAVVRGVFTVTEIEAIEHRLPDLTAAGDRTLLDLPWCRQLASSDRIQQLLMEAVGEGYQPVRAILFEKSAAQNWTLALHRDTKIAVKAKFEVEGFGNWSVKQGTPHCQPPDSFLAKCVAVRIHIDPCGLENGPILAVPGSHKSESQTASKPYPAELGDVILMRPLTLHGSERAQLPNRRRVLHIEFSSATLPPPLEWAYS